MVKILVQFCVDADIIECPEWMMSDLKQYQKSFKEWLFDKENDHPYWCYKKGEKNGCHYRSSAFVEWLNYFVLDNSLEKSKVLEECINDRTGIICRTVYPKYIDSKGSDLRENFINWLQDKDEHGDIRKNAYIKVYGENRYSKYALAEWLNQFVLSEWDDKAYVIDKQVAIEEIENMHRINF